MTSDHRSPSDIQACLTYADAAAAIEWLSAAFGFTAQLVVAADDGAIIHSELSLGTGVVMVSSPKPEDGRHAPRAPGGAPATLSVYVPDPDAHHARAVAAGARVLRPLRNEAYDARGYMAEDPEGYRWYFGNYRPGAYWRSPPASASEA